MTSRRRGLNELQVLALLHRSGEGQYGLALAQEAGINVGTVYAVMARLTREGLVGSVVEDADPQVLGRPTRRYYTLTQEGQQVAQEEVARTRQMLRAPPADEVA